MRRSFPTFAVGAVLALMAVLPAQAIGFARTVNNTQLGQPLDFAAFVRLEGGESLPRECVVADVTAGENRLLGGQVRVTVQPAVSPDERVVRVTTTVPIDEPVVTVEVVLGCNARLTRSFVSFVDPPAVTLAQSAPGEVVPVQRLESPVAPVVDAVRDIAAAATAARPAPAGRDAPAAAPPRPAPPPRLRVAAQAAAPNSQPAASPLPRRATAPRPPAAGPRLKLDPAVGVVASKAVAAAPTTPAPPAAPEPAVATAAAAVAAPTPAAAASPDPAASSVDELAARLVANEQQQRVAALEQTLQRMRAEAEATQVALRGLQAELQAARAGGGAASGPVVALLAAACALLALLLFVVWRRQARDRAPPVWWSPPAPTQAFGPGSGPAGTTIAPAAVAERDPTDRDTMALVRPAAPAPPAGPASQQRREPAADPVPQRELSVEELIDLEQQADFFVVLGQDEAAIDLLVGHVRSSGGSSPLPYLKLLEIYARRADREAYERTRERFNRRFNAYAPEWGVNLLDGKSLEDYREVIGRLQMLWTGPRRVMEVMDTLLFRRDAEAPTFDLPAYRELLFLYAIARDLVQTGNDAQLPARPVGRIDLALPIEPERSFAEETLPLLTNVPEGYRPTEAPPAPAIDIDLTEPSPLTTDFRGLVDIGRKPGSN